jgi:ABC-2 type transport system permease protein
VLSVLISIAITIVGLAILAIRDLPTPDAGELLELLARNALVAALLGAFGVGIGALVRNQVVAVVGLLVVGFAIDPLVAALLPEVGRFSPFSALPVGISDVPPEDAGLPDDLDVLSPGLAVLAMLAWIGAAFAPAAALLIRRDLD